jgi:VIT1/CCC1 family predicted Fe2+/Mn2+ transporter
MPQTPHVEKHFTASETVRDIVIGMSDGLAVPFVLAAGLSGAVETTGIIITAGLAEVAAGAIAMGLGGYLAAKTDAEHFASERAREERETQEMPETEAAEVADIMRTYGLNDETAATVGKAIRGDRRRWVDFMMRFELGLEEPWIGSCGHGELRSCGHGELRIFRHVGSSLLHSCLRLSQRLHVSLKACAKSSSRWSTPSESTMNK